MPDNGRNRPSRYGGAYDFSKDPTLAARNKKYVEGSKNGLDPIDHAALVRRGIEENKLYIVTQPERRASVGKKFDEIRHAFNAVDERLPKILAASRQLNFCERNARVTKNLIADGARMAPQMAPHEKTEETFRILGAFLKR